MKNRLIPLLALASLVILSCTSPTKDFDIHISPTFYKYVVNIDLTEAENPQNPFNGSVTIDITGPDASAIYSIDGTKNYSLNHGSIQLIVARQNEPSAGSPLNFRVRISANNHKAVSLPVQIGLEDYYLRYSVPMIDFGNLPDGIGNIQSSGSVSGGTLAQPIVITASSTDNVSRATLTIPTTTTFSNSNGNSITGSQLNIDILSLSDTSAGGQAALPDGTGLIQKVNVDGEVLDLLLEPSATFEIDMDIDGQNITNFNGSGVKMEISIPNLMYNEDAGRNYQAGDSISLISHSEGADSWQDEGTYLVKNDGQGGLIVDPTITHLSYYKLIGKSYRLRRSSFNLYKFYTFLPSGTAASISGNLALSIKFTRGIHNFIWRTNLYGIINTTRKLRRVLIASPNTGVEVSPLSSGSINSNFYDINITEPVPGEVDIEVIPLNGGVDVSFSLYCSGNNTVINPPAGVKIYYKESSDPDAIFQHLYTFSQNNNTVSSGRIYQLQDGMQYDFRALFNQYQVDTANVLVEDGKHYQVILPQAACNEIL